MKTAPWFSRVDRRPEISLGELDHNMSLEPEIEGGHFTLPRRRIWTHVSARIVDWNIGRGQNLGGILDFLADANADLIILQEVDQDARRTRRRNIAREIAQKLQMNYVFGCEFRELTQGTEKSPAYHGQATLSPWPFSSSRIVRFRSQSDFWRPRWFLPNIEPFQRRIGGRMALVSEVSIAGRKLCIYNLHLESRGGDRVRQSQLGECLDDVRRSQWDEPVVLAGDFNLDASAGAAANAIRQANFQSAVSEDAMRTTTPDTVFKRGKTIDCIFTRGNIRAVSLQIHSSVPASDHFPLSADLEIYSKERPATPGSGNDSVRFDMTFE
jgi:endonuclease/exonuclease/phosphatase family metal-dependent hydrolase